MKATEAVWSKLLMLWQTLRPNSGRSLFVCKSSETVFLRQLQPPKVGPQQSHLKHTPIAALQDTQLVLRRQLGLNNFCMGVFVLTAPSRPPPIRSHINGAIVLFPFYATPLISGCKGKENHDHGREQEVGNYGRLLGTASDKKQQQPKQGGGFNVMMLGREVSNKICFMKQIGRLIHVVCFASRHNGQSDTFTLYPFLD
ncbi:unnamed protein product [Polarella glacialis]|uniref:Uncharacterized protein n=1 Tax=Polarella glacialis TaxID=89957 RepID=A0A813M8F9_POLGL|nr:unnamed protein product [Polarella glacialis]